MDGFQVFNKGNRQKFLTQAKKNKQQSSLPTHNPNHPAHPLLLKIQKNIRKFLARSQPSSGLAHLHHFSTTATPLEIVGQLQQLRKSNLFLFDYLYRMGIRRIGDMGTRDRKGDIGGQEQLRRELGRFADRIGAVFGRLIKRERVIWVREILKYTPQFSFAYMKKDETKQVFDILTADMETFLSIVGSLPCCNLVSELVTLVSSYPLKSQPSPPQSPQLLPPLSQTYQTLQKTLSSSPSPSPSTYPHPTYLTLLLSHLLLSLHTQCQFSIMQKYKIDLNFLKADNEHLQQVIKEKEEWECFVDFLGLNCQWNLYVLKWFVGLADFGEAAVGAEYVGGMLRLVLGGDLGGVWVGDQELMVCFRKVSQWIKIHQIVQSESQQTLLLPFLYLISLKFFKMTDKQFITLIQKQGEVLQKMLKDKFIKLIYKLILNSKISRKLEQLTKICINFLQDIYNKIFRTGVLSTEIFVNEVMSKKFVQYTQAKSDNQIVEFVRRFPFIFSLRDRARKFHQILREYHYANMDMDDEYQGNFNGRVKIRRGHQFDDAFYYLGKRNIRKGFQISFIDQYGQEEKGVDAGGLTKQFINRVLKAAFQSELGMFVQNSQKQLLPHPEKAQYDEGIIAEHYEFIGKMIGKALYEGITIGPKFCGPFLNAIIGKKNNFDDLNKIDKHLYNSLAYIKTMKQDASELYLTFQYNDQTLHKKIHLKKHGNKIKLTNQNKQQYISLLSNYRVNKLLEYQSRHIRRGLKKVINSQWLFMFNYQELNYLISGSGEIKVHQLRNYTRYVGYQQNDLTIRMFWSVVMEFDEETKSNLLMFVTACPRPSFLGFEEMSPPFTISKMNDKKSLPVSHTCMNLLELPDYQNKEILAEKLKLAINSGSGFHIA